jgi:anti-anti-sigma regulatory factor
MSLLRGATADEQPMAGWLESDTMYSDKQLVIRHTIPTNGLSFAGVIDVLNADQVAAALIAQLDEGRPLHLELSRVEFSDVSGIRAFVLAAESADAGSCIVLHGLPTLLQKVMTVVGWGDLPGLEICSCGPA